MLLDGEKKKGGKNNKNSNNLLDPRLGEFTWLVAWARKSSCDQALSFRSDRV